MNALPSDLRNKLERVIIEARDAAEVGAQAALEALAVNHYEPYPHMKPEERKLRNQLRARARQLGDRKFPRADASGKDHEIIHLIGECAYEHWHRMLFARFLAENNLLIEPEENMAISLTEAEELANEEGLDVWVYASRCAQQMLPQIFRPDDPLLQVSFATEHMLKLERLLASLPEAVFTASDALGWVYQFWQSKKKDEVNRSEVKIGADEIAAVTQLFTEPYMVEFLIHNTLGAWWAGKKFAANPELARNAESEEELRLKLSLPGVTWDYLRFVRSAPSPSTGDGRGEGDSVWRPAAGAFDGWPKNAKQIKALDPCSGSGHFLVALFRHLVPIRMIEEGLSTREAADAVLRDNIHGLEIDERCCQIAAFALALAAWTYSSSPSTGEGRGEGEPLGYRPLPELHIACTGIGPQATEEQWLKLAEKFGMPTKVDERERVKNGLRNLHRLFSQAPTLGSLIDPRQLQADVFAAGYETIQPYLSAVLKGERTDDEAHEQAIAAAGMVKAADLLAGEYTLVITNVPYLARGKQGDTLMEYLDAQYPQSRHDLATAFLERAIAACGNRGVVGIVILQNWVFLSTYKRLRKHLLSSYDWRFLARLGAKGFRTPMWDFNVMLLILAAQEIKTAAIADCDVSAATDADLKSAGLADAPIELLDQQDQLRNRDSMIIRALAHSISSQSLGDHVSSHKGICTGDLSRFARCFSELPSIDGGWVLFRTSVSTTSLFDGCQNALFWENGAGHFINYVKDRLDGSIGTWIRGQDSWGRQGIAISRMAGLPCTIYCGELFDDNSGVLIPNEVENLTALWTFCESDDFRKRLRAINQKLSVDNTYLNAVPFDLAHWQKVAAEKYPHGLPEPESEDPTQWLFHGYPYETKEELMLQVAVARLLGYRWPAEQDDKMRLSTRARSLVKQCEELAKFADNDGIVCIPAVRGEDPAAERLLQLLNACDIEPGVDLDTWLRNSFFEEHCKLFHDRPFVWHIWDGRKNDGFHALINYHKLAEGGGKGRRLLESLTYAYLGEWITRQKDGVKRGEEGADDRLAAALELQKRLEAILTGEPPFDIFVRWKLLAQQPIGWEPDIKGGVKMNMRPFLASDLPGGGAGAGVLRYKPNIKWKKDRGKEPTRPKDEYPWFWGWDEKTMDFMGGKSFDGNRWNDCHYTNEAKQKAHSAAKT